MMQVTVYTNLKGIEDARKERVFYAQAISDGPEGSFHIALSLPIDEYELEELAHHRMFRVIKRNPPEPAPTGYPDEVVEQGYKAYMDRCKLAERAPLPYRKWAQLVGIPIAERKTHYEQTD